MNNEIILKVENHEDANFEHWCEVLHLIYGNKNLEKKPGDMWLRTVSDASKVGEAIRKGEAYDAMKHLTHTLSWIITTVKKLLEWHYNGHNALLTYDLKPHTYNGLGNSDRKKALFKVD